MKPFRIRVSLLHHTENADSGSEKDECGANIHKDYTINDTDRHQIPIN